MHKSKRDCFHAYMVRGAKFCGNWDIPLLENISQTIPERMVLFTNRAKDNSPSTACLHFYTDDWRFTGIWNYPIRYLKTLQRYGAVVTPDFSVYMDMPLALQVDSVYRSHAVGFWLGKCGIPVIPNIRWGDERSYEFCFDGIPTHSMVAIGTNGCLRNPLDRKTFKLGLDVMCFRLQPHTILVYGPTPKDMFQSCVDAGIKVVPYEAEARRVRNTQKKERTA